MLNSLIKTLLRRGSDQVTGGQGASDHQKVLNVLRFFKGR